MARSQKARSAPELQIRSDAIRCRAETDLVRCPGVRLSLAAAPDQQDKTHLFLDDVMPLYYVGPPRAVGIRDA